MKHTKISPKKIVISLLSIFILYKIFSIWYDCRIYKLELDTPNPREFTFAKPLKVIEDSLRRYPAKLITIDIGYTFQFTENKILGYKRGPNVGHSYRYRYKKDSAPLDESISFDVYMNPISDDSTKVIVLTSKNTIYYGPTLPIGHPIQLCRENVPSSTIEEYEMLRFIGKLIGELDRMPLVNYPNGLSRDEILQSFYPWNPFTYEEMFGNAP